jgi:hypothetical protein
MNKKLKEMLQNSEIQLKWRNFTKWQNNKINLLEFCKINGLKITKKGNYYNLKLNLPGNNFLKKTHIIESNLERSIYEFVYIYNVCLGDKFKLKTRFKNYSFY